MLRTTLVSARLCPARLRSQATMLSGSNFGLSRSTAGDIITDMIICELFRISKQTGWIGHAPVYLWLAFPPGGSSGAQYHPNVGGILRIFIVIFGRQPWYMFEFVSNNSFKERFRMALLSVRCCVRINATNSFDATCQQTACGIWQSVLSEFNWDQCGNPSYLSAGLVATAVMINLELTLLGP